MRTLRICPAVAARKTQEIVNGPHLLLTYSMPIAMTHLAGHMPT